MIAHGSNENVKLFSQNVASWILRHSNHTPLSHLMLSIDFSCPRGGDPLLLVDLVMNMYPKCKGIIYSRKYKTMFSSVRDIDVHYIRV